MRTDWLPPKGTCVVLDTNVLSYANRSAYGISCGRLLAQLASDDVKLIIPQVVEYEVLRHARTQGEYRQLKDLLREFQRWPLMEHILVTATKMQVLFMRHDISRRFAVRKDSLADMLIIATAGKHQIETKCSTYILSGDQDFPLPYIAPVSRSTLINRNPRSQSQYLHFFEVDIQLVNADWERFCHQVEGEAPTR